MKRVFLTDLGLDTDVVDKIMKEHGSTVNSLKDELEKVDEYKSQVEDLQEQLSDRDKQLEELSQKAKDNEELVSEIDKLKEQNKETAKESEKKLADQRKEYKLELALKDAKARNTKAVKALLDLETIKLDGDELKGLNEQLENLQKENDYLFGDEKLGGREPHIPKDEPKTPNNPFCKEHFNMTEQGQLIRNEPDKAKELIKQAGGNPALYGL
jgi:DNA repair exonuclease SbcCD ATPase subunit